ncbi:Gfo/Idh/MocA family oxidoreductase [Streptacidiphilus sp. P02-A3a]|nr:Gfo/Idh/MocA family oxidoreductase [Streptacidiphilus sp. P02-A3a]
MLRTLVVGLGRAGAGLHVPVLLRVRHRHPRLFAPEAILAVDPARSAGTGAAGLRAVGSLADARRQLPPERTVVHVCTPPIGRVEVLGELLELGFRRFVVEKPLAGRPGDLDPLVQLVRRGGAQVAVVAPWLASSLTERLAALVAAADRDGLGALREISVIQHKPRFRRSLTTHGHPTAFDIEVPHALGVVLGLAGDAEVTDAAWTDLALGGHLLPALGSARLGLTHLGGVRSDIFSDLTSPVRERRITLHFDRGTAIGHYPGNSDDEYAQLRVTGAMPTAVEVFPDDSLGSFMVRAYTRLVAGSSFQEDFAGHVRAVELLTRAKQLAAAGHCPPPLGARPDEELSHAR